MDLQSASQPRTISSPEIYLERLFERASNQNNLRKVLDTRDVCTSKVAHVDNDGTAYDSTTANVVRRFPEGRGRHGAAVCIVQTIDAQTIARLGYAWHIPCDFFEGHFAPSSVPTRSDPYRPGPTRRSVEGLVAPEPSLDAGIGEEERAKAVDHTLRARQRHIDGFVPYVTFRDVGGAAGLDFGWYGSRQNTRISYYRAAQDFCRLAPLHTNNHPC